MSNSALAEERQQLLQHPFRTLLRNPMAATFSDTAANVVNNSPP